MYITIHYSVVLLYFEDWLVAIRKHIEILIVADHRDGVSHQGS